MFIDCDVNLIAAWRTIDEVLPYPQYSSGARDDNKSIYKYPANSSSNPILILEFDILNEYGFGLKKGFYEIAPNSEYTCLMFTQAGKIKAKIPIVKQELIHKSGTDFEWEDNKSKNAPLHASQNLDNKIPLYSKKIYQKQYTEKEMKKRKKKYKKGMDPNVYFHATAYMLWDKELSLYKVIWEKYNTRITGYIKL